MSSPFTSPTYHNLTSGFTTLTPMLLCTLQPQQGAWRDDFYKLMLSECEMRSAGHSKQHECAEAPGKGCEHLSRAAAKCTVQEQGVMRQTPGLQFFSQFTSTTHL